MQEPLKPATLENKTPRQYGFKKSSRFQISIVLLACILFSLSILQQHCREKTKVESLTQKITGQIEENEQLEKDFQSAINHTHKLIEQTKNLPIDYSKEPASFKASDLTKKFTLYARIDQKKAEIADQFPDCLGIQPIYLQELLELKSFFEHSWETELQEKKESIELEILTRKIRDQIKKGSPKILDTIQAKYLLVLKELENQQFRISVWDVQKNQILISKKANPNGRLISMGYGNKQNSIGKNTNEKDVPLKLQSTARDCALSAILKDWTGEPSTQM